MLLLEEKKEKRNPTSYIVSLSQVPDCKFFSLESPKEHIILKHIFSFYKHKRSKRIWFPINYPMSQLIHLFFWENIFQNQNMTHILLQAFLLQHPLDVPLPLSQHNHPQFSRQESKHQITNSLPAGQQQQRPVVRITKIRFRAPVSPWMQDMNSHLWSTPISCIPTKYFSSCWAAQSATFLWR